MDPEEIFAVGIYSRFKFGKRITASLHLLPGLRTACSLVIINLVELKNNSIRITSTSTPQHHRQLHKYIPVHWCSQASSLTNTHCCSACSLCCAPPVHWLVGWLASCTSGPTRNQRRPSQIPKSGLQLHRYDDPPIWHLFYHHCPFSPTLSTP